MPLATPLPFREAALRIGQGTIVPSTLSHAELGEIAVEIRERTFTSAKVANAEALQRIRQTIQQIVDGKMTEIEARKALRSTALPISRINLIVDTQTGFARGYGQWKQSQSEDGLRAKPCWELFRAEQRVEPRNWPERWANAGGEFYDGQSDYPEGRMIAPINDPIWTEISAFGQPYPPFDFQSGMWTRRIGRQECVDLGVITPDQVEEPEDRPFSDFEEYGEPEMDEDLREALLESMGPDYEFDEDGVLTRK